MLQIIKNVPLRFYNLKKILLLVTQIEKIFKYFVLFFGTKIQTNIFTSARFARNVVKWDYLRYFSNIVVSSLFFFLRFPEKKRWGGWTERREERELVEGWGRGRSFKIFKMHLDCVWRSFALAYNQKSLFVVPSEEALLLPALLSPLNSRPNIYMRQPGRCSCTTVELKGTIEVA